MTNQQLFYGTTLLLRSLLKWRIPKLRLFFEYTNANRDHEVRRPTKLPGGHLSDAKVETNKQNEFCPLMFQASWHKLLHIILFLKFLSSNLSIYPTKKSDRQIFIWGNVCNCKANYFLHCFENIKSRRAYGGGDQQKGSSKSPWRKKNRRIALRLY